MHYALAWRWRMMVLYEYAESIGASPTGEVARVAVK
jgi:hypothetical protein